MFKNYFRTAWRNLWKSRFYTILNIFGLAIGLAVGIIILLWVKDELSYDRFNSKSPLIYRTNAHIGTGTSAQVWNNVPAPIGVYSKNQIPAVKNSVRIASNYDYGMFSYHDKQFTKTKTAFIDGSFFSIFDIRLLKGDVKNPFPDNNSIIISSATAKMFFGNDDPIGKIIVADNKENFTVRGVMQDFPENFSLQYDMFLPLSMHERDYGKDHSYWKSMNEDWGNYMYTTFVLVQPDASLKAIEKKLTQLQHEHNPGAMDVFYTLQPLAKLHLYDADGSSSARQMVQIFFIVAVLLLIIACINYVNLSTARAILRAKEVSVRKIIGAAKTHLFTQFIIETIILFAIATVVAIIIIASLIPLYNNISGKHTHFSIADAGMWSTIGITTTAALLASSVYPAMLLSSFKPIFALKGKLSLGIGSSMFRKILVVAQFSFSVMLIIGTLIIGKQLRYIQERQLGYDKSYVFYFFMRDLMGHYDAAKADLLKEPFIKDVSASSGNIVSIDNTTGDTEWDGKESNRMFLIHPITIDANFIPMMKLKMVAGSNFTGSIADSAHYILNETAVKEAGIKDPIGKRFKLWQTYGTIVGVVKDFHLASLKQKIEPAIFAYDGNHGRNAYFMYIRTTGKDAPKALAAAEKWWKKYNAGFPFDYRFLDEAYDKMYKSDQRTGTLFNLFAAIAIFISCLGLFGLTTYTAQVKTREIGIRKVLGATVTSITGLLAKDFIGLVIIAITIASPFAWYGMNKWLQNFAYQTSLNGWIFIGAGLIAVLIALITVSFQSIRAALANPVHSLRNE